MNGEEPLTIRVGVQRDELPEHVRALRRAFASFELREVKPIDGDTIKCSIVVPFIESTLLVSNQTIRLSYPGGEKYFNTWEIRGDERPKGLLAKEALAELIYSSAKVMFSCHGREKFGRYIGSISCDGVDAATYMREKGHTKIVV